MYLTDLTDLTDRQWGWVLNLSATFFQGKCCLPKKCNHLTLDERMLIQAKV